MLRHAELVVGERIQGNYTVALHHTQRALHPAHRAIVHAARLVLEESDPRPERGHRHRCAEEGLRTLIIPLQPLAPSAQGKPQM